MVETFGFNSFNNNGTTSLPPEVQEELDVEKGEDIIVFEDCPEDGKAKIRKGDKDNL